MMNTRIHANAFPARWFVPERTGSRFLMSVAAAAAAIVVLGVFVAPGRRLLIRQTMEPRDMRIRAGSLRM